MTRSSVVTPIPTVTGPSNVSGPNESAANGSFKPPRLVGRLGQETVDATTEQSVACHWQCQCPLQHPVLLVNPGRPLAPECGEGGPRVPCRVAWPALLRRLGGCSRKTLSRGGYYWVVGGPGSMCPESVPCGSAGKEYAGITGTLFSTRHSYLGSGRIRFTTRGRSAWP